MKKYQPLLILALSMIVLFAVGCAQKPFIEPTPIPTLAPATMPSEHPTPVVAGGEMTPTTSPGGEPAVTPDLVEAGRQVFEQNCTVCHNLTAETKVGPGLQGIFGKDQLPNGQPVNDENVKAWIRSGGGAMPGFPLPDDQVEALIAFLKDATQ